MLSASHLKIVISAVLAVILFPTGLWGQTAEVYVSSKSGERLARKPSVTFQPTAATRAATFEVNDSVKYQKMDGFGASLLEAGLIVLNSLPAKPAGSGVALAVRPQRRGRIYCHEDRDRRN
jgi:hypothetical protein